MKLDDVAGDNTGIEDRRGRGGGGGFSLGRGGGIGMGKGGKVGIPALIILVVGFFVSQAGGGGGGGGIDITDVIGQMNGQPAASGPAPAEASGSTKDAQYEFVKDVRTLLQDYWRGVFAASGETFEPAGLVVFDAPTQTGGCGVGTPQAGPFYCPADQKMYIDFGFYAQLEKQLGFSGDFAMAYVIAHEYGHHVQNLLGIDKEVRSRSDGASQAEANALSVKVELQADCFAGVWAKSAFEAQRLESGDFDEAITAAEAVGDDAIQSQSGGRVNRETFTHGSSAQREKWFKTGYDSSDASRCDPFS